jgi:large subunit ribosomal protein L4e
MFSPLRTYRKWHRKIVLGHKRYAVASALAASAVPALVAARGHKISQIPEIPLVIANEAFEGITKTKKAAALLKTLSVDDDIQKAKYSVVHRAGLGKMRGRPYKEKLGPILVHSVNGSFGTALRNLPGLEIVHVDRLSLLRLAPGGHLGRFIIWTRGAFEKLDTNWGTRTVRSQTKKGYRLPYPILANPDITRIITSDEIRSAIRPIRHIAKHRHWVNPFRNPKRMAELNPYVAIQTAQRRKAAIANRAKRVKSLAEKKQKWTSAKNEEYVKERRGTAKKAAADKKTTAPQDVKEAVTKGITTVTKKLSLAFKKLLKS